MPDLDTIFDYFLFGAMAFCLIMAATMFVVISWNFPEFALLVVFGFGLIVALGWFVKEIIKL